MIEVVIWDFGGVLSSSPFWAFAFDQLFAAESLALGAEVRSKDVLPLSSGETRSIRKKENDKVGNLLGRSSPANEIAQNRRLAYEIVRMVAGGRYRFSPLDANLQYFLRSSA